MNKTLLLVLLLSLATLKGISQGEITDIHALSRGGEATSSSRESDCLGINPGNLGLKPEDRLVVSVGGLSATVSSTALERSDVRRILFSQSSSALTLEQKKVYGNLFADKGFSNQGDLQIIGVYAKIPVVGAFAGSIRFRSAGNMQLSPLFSDVLFNGYHAALFDSIHTSGSQSYGTLSKPRSLREITYGSKISQMAWLEYNIGWGLNYTKVLHVIDVCLGINVKYIQGVGMVDYNPSKFSNGLGVASLPQGNSFNNISLGSPFSILNSQFNTTSNGWGFDIGSTFHVGTGTTLGLSVCNIGLINWTKNVHQIEASSLDTLKYNGVSDFQLYNQVNDLFSGKTDLFKTTSLEKYRTSLPTQVRFGVSQNIFKVFHAGFDIVIPVTTSPGNLQQPLFSLGGEIKLTHWTIGSGYSQGGNLINGCWSAGLFWHTKKKFFECGIATRDWLSYFKPSNSNLSFAMLTAKFSAF